MAAWQSVAIALAIGLLIGAARDGRPDRGAGQQRSWHAGGPSVLRLAALAALAGVAAALVGPVMLAAAVIGAALLCAAVVGGTVLGDATVRAALRLPSGPRTASTAESDAGLEPEVAQRRDPTTAIALAVTVLLGGLVVTRPALAVGAAVAAALVVLSRSAAPRLLRERIAELELSRALVFAVVAFLVLPLAPSTSTGPLGAIDPRRMWTVVVAVTALGGLGYALVRLGQPATGRPTAWRVPLAGLAGGFVSGAATTGAMARMARDATRFRPAMAGALLATVATLVLLVPVIAIVDTRVAGLVTPAVCLAVLTLVGEALWLVLARPARHNAAPDAEDDGPGEDGTGEDGVGEDGVGERGPAQAEGAPAGVDGWVVPSGRSPTRVSSMTIIEDSATITAIDFGAGAEKATMESTVDSPTVQSPIVARPAAARPTVDSPTVELPRAEPPRTVTGRRPFDLAPALLLAGMVVGFVVLAALALQGVGAAAAVLTVAVAGLADAFAGSISAAELAFQGRWAPGTAVLAVAAALAASAAVRLLVAYVAGGRRVSAALAALYAGPVVAFAVGLALALGLS